MDINVDSDPGYEIVVEFGGEAHTCDQGEKLHEFDVDINGTTTLIEDARMGAEKEDGYHTTFFDLLGDKYQFDVRLGDPDEIGFGTNMGTITGTHPNQTLTQHILLEGLIFETAGCEKGENICHLAIEITVDGPFNDTTMMVGSMNGSGTPALTFCSSPFSALDSNLITFTGLTFDDEMPT